jgi:hypothetical protein
MNHDPIQDWSKLPWESTRPDVATGVLGSKVVPKGADIHTVTLTRVEPKGHGYRNTNDSDLVLLTINYSDV